MRVVITRLAKVDIAETVAWYRKRSDQAPRAFISELEEVIYGIRQHPRRWPPLAPEDRRRVAMLHRFPYEMIYLPTEKQIKVLAIRHEKRRPEFGTDRK